MKKTKEKRLRRDIIWFMDQVPYLKKLAKKAGLNASYIPCVGAVEIFYMNIPIGITWNAKHIKLYSNNKFYNINKWINIFRMTSFLQNL